MKKIEKEKDDWGQYVIYVQRCSKYKYENQERPKVRLNCIYEYMKRK